jgi:cytochrome c-type biogenesis protein CcmE
MSTDTSSSAAPSDAASADSVAAVDLEDRDAAAPTPPRAPRRKRRWTGWITLALLVVVVGLIASTVRPGRGAFVYSKYVDEVMGDPHRYVNSDLRVEGIVQQGTLENRAGSNEFSFRIERNNRSMPVHYTGVVPDTFREGIGVTVRGRLHADGSFVAQEVVAKCPSKYEMQAASARGERMPPGMTPTAPSSH